MNPVRCSALLLAVLSSLPGTAWALGKGLLDEDPEVVAKLKPIERHRAFLPPSVDLSGWFPEAGNQGMQGSCVGWAVGYGLRTYYAKRSGEPGVDGGDTGGFSPAYVFNQIKANRDNCEGGSRITDALNLLVTEGVAPLKLFPYSPETCQQAPDAAARQTARRYQMKSFRRVPLTKLDDVKGQLSNGHPVAFGMLVNSNFEKWRGNGVFSDLDLKEGEGGHAMVVAGYDEGRRAFRIFNSWSKHWGDQGYAWVDYDTFTKRTKYAFVAEPLLGFSTTPPPPPPVTPKPAPAVVVPAPTVVVVTPQVLPVPPQPAEPPAPPPPAPAPQTVVILTPEVIPVPPPAPDPAPVVVVTPPAPEVPAEPPVAPPPAPVVAVIDPPRPVEPPAPPSPAPPDAKTRRSQLLAALAGLPCASVSAEPAGQDDRLRLTGFVGDSLGLELAREFTQQAGFEIADQSVAVRKWPQCEALQTFDAWLAPKAGKVELSLAGTADAGGTTVLKNGDFLELEVKTPSRPAHVWVTYIPADGSAVQLVQPRAGDKLHPAGTVLKLGADPKKRRFRIAPPLGDEMVIVFASEKRLFKEPLPDLLEEREFLTRFRQALLATQPGKHSSAAVQVLKTIE